MTGKTILTLALALAASAATGARTETPVKHWQFSADSATWKPVTIPHDLSLIHI